MDYRKNFQSKIDLDELPLVYVKKNKLTMFIQRTEKMWLGQFGNCYGNFLVFFSVYGNALASFNDIINNAK